MFAMIKGFFGRSMVKYILMGATVISVSLYVWVQRSHIEQLEISNGQLNDRLQLSEISVVALKHANGQLKKDAVLTKSIADTQLEEVILLNSKVSNLSAKTAGLQQKLKDLLINGDENDKAYIKTEVPLSIADILNRTANRVSLDTSATSENN